MIKKIIFAVIALVVVVIGLNIVFNKEPVQNETPDNAANINQKNEQRSDLTPVGSANVVQKGNRSLGLQITASENGSYDDGFKIAKKAGIDAGKLFIIWTDLEKSPNNYEPVYFHSIGSTSGLPKGIKVHLMLAAIDVTAKKLPNDIANKPFNDPAVIDRYEKALDYLFSKIPDEQLQSLSLGNEIDSYLNKHSGEWKQYQVFYEAVAKYVKSKKPNLKVGVTATFKGLTQTAKSNYQTLNKNSDVIMVNYYPVNDETDFSVKNPSVVHKDFAALLPLYPNTPFYVMEIGYPTSNVLKSTEKKQKQFIIEVFKMWDKNAGRIPYMGFFNLHDWSKKTTDEFTKYYGFGSGSKYFSAFLGTLGLRHSDSTDKPGFKQFVLEAKARGW